MESEAHKLISLSLNKIVASRSQRGGLNLRKSLLLTHVLQQAKNVYIVENYESLVAVKTNQGMTVSSEVIVRKPSPERTSGDIDHQSQTTVQMASSAHMDTSENSLTSASNGSVEDDRPVQESQEDPRTFNAGNEHPNEPLDIGTLTSDIDLDSCARRTKRKLEEVSPNSDTKIDEVSSPVKKFKDNCTTTNDSSQISALIHKFSAGFSGLVNSCPTSLTDSSSNPQSGSCGFGLGHIGTHPIALAV